MAVAKGNPGINDIRRHLQWDPLLLIKKNWETACQFSNATDLTFVAIKGIINLIVFLKLSNRTDTFSTLQYRNTVILFLLIKSHTHTLHVLNGWQQRRGNSFNAVYSQ